MIGDLLGGAGLVLAAAGAAYAVWAPPSRARSVAMLVALVLAPVLIAGDGWDTARFEDLRDSPARTAVLIAAAVVVVLALAWVVRRRRWLLAPLIVAALPFRVPLEAGGEQANLLVPLYLVIAAGVLAAVVIPGWGAERANGQVRAVVWLRRILAGFVLLYALQALYSEDMSRGLQNVCFFFVPFSLVFALLGDLRWDRRALLACAAVAGAQALLFALVGLGQYVVGELFWNDEVILANEFHSYFRVNSFFWDPNILGRYLALVALIGVAALIWTADTRRVLLLTAGIAVLMAGLAVTFSQSSYAAMLAGLAVLAGLRWSARWTATLVAIPAAAALVVGINAVADTTSDKTNVDTGGRLKLIEGGVELFGDRPVWGYGSGSFSAAYEAQVRDRPALVTESHTEPVTVAAEQGLIGLVPYLALLFVAFWALAHGFRGLMPGVRGPPPAAATATDITVARAAVFAASAALLAHSVSYAGFFVDPITWVLLAVGAALAAWPARPGRAG